MAYRVNSIEVPLDNPFANDAFERREVVELLKNLVARTGGPFVMALDSPWGTGKSVLVQMLRATLSNEDFQCVYFDAWKSDHVIDPLVALVASVESALKEASRKKALPGIKNVKKITGILAKRGAVAGIKAVTLGGLDLDEEVEAIVAELGSDSFSDLVDAYKVEVALFDRFRTELEKTVSALELNGKKPTLVFFIDELDRCRPSFAIQLLERIKHLFDLANIFFVLSVDKKQLEAVVRAVYGSSIDAQEYLRRFFDIEYGLPSGDSKAFTMAMLQGFDIDSYFFDEDGRGPVGLVQDRELFVEYFTALADIYGLTLRARERCITRFKIVLDLTPKKQNLHPQLVALLIVVRAIDYPLFKKITDGAITPFEVLDDIRGRDGGGAFEDSDKGCILLGLLIAYFPVEKEGVAHSNFAIRKMETSSGNQEKKWTLVAQIVTTEKKYTNIGNFKNTARKIDIASGVK